MAAVHLDQVTYRRSVLASRGRSGLLAFGFPCRRLAEDASLEDHLWRVTESGAMRAITGFLTRERNPVVPACDGVFIRRSRDFLVRLGAVKTYFRCVE